MAGQIKVQLFQSLRKYFEILGTFSPESDNSGRFNSRNIFTLLLYIQMFAAVLACTLFKATTVIEYGLNYYGYVTEVLHVFVISTQIFRMINIIKLIENCEKFIEKSEEN